MKTQNKYWMTIWVALSVTLAALFMVSLLFWRQLLPDGKQILSTMIIDDFGYFFAAGFVLFLAFGFAADWIFRAYVKPINRMAEEIDMINRVNPDMRVTISGSHDVRRLGKIINYGAELLSDLPKKQANKRNSAQFETETEKAILATFLSNLPQAILVCNLDGRIVFYNRKVKDLLLSIEKKDQDLDGSDDPWIGLGRSVYHFINRNLIQEALERMANLLAKDRSSSSERFLISSNHDAVMPAELIPVLDSQHHITGYMVYIEDLVAKMKREKVEARHLQIWQHQLTQSISIIKTASEILRDEPNQSNQAYQQMVQILAEQSDLAAQLWTKKEISNKWTEKRPVPLTPTAVKDWAHHLAKQLAPVIHLELTIDPGNQPPMISIDIYHLTQSMVAILSNIQRRYNIVDAKANFYEKEAWLYVDVIWQGEGIEDNVLKQWKAVPHDAEEKRPAIRIKSILAYHGAKLWSHRNPELQDYAGLRLLIPTITGAAPIDVNGRLTVLPEARPEFYDFNLFQQAGQSRELNKRRLDDLTYTVFDTETTGLDPRGGDEIISIGAMRIVNGRLLQEEQFSRLIDPKRHLPWASIKYHGIRPEMLTDQPTIEQVLPKFQRFVQGTVLVGHNVAFDMRMLQMKEVVTGVKFINPVLDTMLLSSIVHPAHESHSLSDVAARIGVQIKGRHSALGDARATAEIFLKLLSLLSEKGIDTLGEAVEASKTSYFAHMKY